MRMTSKMDCNIINEDFKNLTVSGQLELAENGENLHVARPVLRARRKHNNAIGGEVYPIAATASQLIRITTNDLLPSTFVGSDDERTDQVEVGLPESCNRNRRFSLRPRKRGLFVEAAGDENENKKKQRKYNFNLETIFEEPVWRKNGSVELIDKRKIKRSINFTTLISKIKMKKRRDRVKKYGVGNSNTTVRRKRGLVDSLQELKEKLMKIDEEEGEGKNGS